MGINYVHTIKIPSSTLNFNETVVKIVNNYNTLQKCKISTGIIHSKFHRIDGAIVTIKANRLWNNAEVTRGVCYV